MRTAHGLTSALCALMVLFGSISPVLQQTLAESRVLSRRFRRARHI